MNRVLYTSPVLRHNYVLVSRIRNISHLELMVTILYGVSVCDLDCALEILIVWFFGICKVILDMCFMVVQGNNEDHYGQRAQ